jgi:hypothetical protein
LALSHRRADIAGFWVVVATLLVAGVASAAALAGAPVPLAWGFAAAGAALAPAALWRDWFDAGITVWNGVTHRLAAVLRAYVLRVTYVTLIVAVGYASRVGGISASPAPAWRRRRPDAGASPNARDDAGQDLSTFVRGAGGAWARCLLPIVWLLTRLGTEQRASAPPSSTYTLY